MATTPGSFCFFGTNEVKAFIALPLSLRLLDGRTLRIHSFILSTYPVGYTSANLFPGGVSHLARRLKQARPSESCNCSGCGRAGSEEQLGIGLLRQQWEGFCVAWDRLLESGI